MRQITGTHVLFGLIAFFGVMLAANGVFVYFATSTFSGLSTDDAYRKGLAYNQTLRSFRAQQASGWQVAAAIAGGEIRLTLADAAGKPLDGLAIAGRIGRPATAAEDRAVAFRSAGQGLYKADADGLAPGQWELTAEARALGQASSEPFKVTARLWVPQP